MQKNEKETEWNCGRYKRNKDKEKESKRREKERNIKHKHVRNFLAYDFTMIFIWRLTAGVQTLIPMRMCSYLAVVGLSGDGLGVGADESVEQAERGWRGRRLRLQRTLRLRWQTTSPPLQVICAHHCEMHAHTHVTLKLLRAHMTITLPKTLLTM